MIQPIGDRVLIRQKKEDTTTTSGIILDSETVRTFPIGTIVALGDGSNVQSSNLTVGDTIHFNGMAGEEIKEEKEVFVIVKMNDILAKSI